ncbi:MAG: DUF6519 domain-containing protein, partial [Chloroflexota bacterium]
MNGDFTRLTFDPDRHYSSVRLQQGRVLLDADWNEHVDIQAHRDRTATRDVVGRCGGPLHEAGFALVPAAGTSDTWGGVIGAGRYYVDGTLCENELDTLFVDQPDLPAAALPSEAGTYVAYLDIWQRHLTAIEQPELREVALGGPDTTTRTKTAWQVNLERVGDIAAEVSCAAFRGDWAPAGTGSSGRLRARAEPAPPTADECLVPPGAGFRRLENQLYRVEIHTPPRGAPAAPATFKWSRENASVVARVERIEGNVITISGLVRDAALGFGPGQWVELSDQQRALSGQPGVLVQLQAAQGSDLLVQAWPDGAPPALGAGPVARRWDSPGAVPITPGTPTEPAWIDLEDGVQVEFIGGEYRTGDFWLIPARSLTGSVEWPQVGGEPVFQLRHGTEHHYCAIGLLRFDGAAWTILRDCRLFFPPTTELLGLAYAGGGGQEAIPDPANPGHFRPLARPLQVRVTNGQWPVQGASVVFRVVTPGPEGPVAGLLTTVGEPAPESGTEVTATTNADGLTACTWQLDERYQTQQVVALLLTEAGERFPVRFEAQLSRAAAVAYAPGACAPLAGVHTVQDAIDLLCLRGAGREPGIHVAKVALTSGPELLNDTNVAVRALVEGIQVACEFDEGAGTALNAASVNHATCFVTLEMPFPFNSADSQLWGAEQVLGFQPLVLAGEPRAEGDTISWQPAAGTATWLQERLFQMMADLRRGDRILARFTLKGNFIGSEGDETTAYLDGEVFGALGREHTGILLPSGDGRRGG